MLAGFNRFQTSLPAKLAFDEDRSHGGRDQGEAHHPAQDDADRHQLAGDGDGDHIPVTHGGQGDQGPPGPQAEASQPGPLGGLAEGEAHGPQENEADDRQDQGKDPFPVQGPD